MDDVTAETLTERLKSAQNEGETLAALVAATRAQIKCQHSLGCRIKAMERHLHEFEASIDAKIDQRVAHELDQKYEALTTLIRSCPARSAASRPVAKGLGVFRGAALKDIIIFLLVAAVAALAGLDVHGLLGG